MQTGIPVVFGVVTTDTVEQAINRSGVKSGNKGYEAAMSAVEIVNLYAEMAGRESEEKDKGTRQSFSACRLKRKERVRELAESGECALQMLFAADVVKNSLEFSTEDYWNELGDGDFDEKTKTFANDLVLGTLWNSNDPSTTRSGHAPNTGGSSGWL